MAEWELVSADTIYNVGDQIEMKKQHPCGSKIFTLLRVGADFRIECKGCDHQMMVPRGKIVKNIKRIKTKE